MTGVPPPPGAPPPPPPPPGGAPPPPPPPPGGAPPPPPYGGTPPPYGGPPGYGPGYPAPKRSNGMSIASLVLGIVGIPLCFLFIPSLLAVIFGGVALNQIKNDPGQSGRGRAIAGIILGCVALALIVVALLFADADLTVE